MSAVIEENAVARRFPGSGRGERRTARQQPAIAGHAPFPELERGWADKVQRAERRLSTQIRANVMLGLVCTVLALAVLYLALFRQPEPYVLQVDAQNNVSFGGTLGGPVRLGDEFVTTQLMAFVENWRTVTPDNTMQKRNIQRLYCMIPKKSSTFKKLNGYFTDPQHDPFKRNTDRSVATRMRQISKLAGSTWQVEWYETVREHSGAIVADSLQHKATMIVERDAVPGDCMEGNPLGVYVMDINWTQVQ